MMSMYCVYCKEKTDTINITPIKSKNNKQMLKGKCKICNKYKTQFISLAEAKKGGFIFTLPAIAAAAGALGSLAGGAAGIATAVNKKKSQDKLLAEAVRHNKEMEKKKSGKGLHLKPYKK